MLKTSKDIKNKISDLDGITPSVLSKLEILKIKTIQDLIFHLPLRYENHTEFTKIKDYKVDQPTNICVSIVGTKTSLTKNGCMLTCFGIDQIGTQINIVFWHLYPNQIKSFKNGYVLQAYGVITQSFGTYSMVHPVFKIYKTIDDIVLPQTLSPIYPTTKGLTNEKLSYLINRVLKTLTTHDFIDLIPTDFNNYTISNIDAIKFIHNPPKDTNLIDLEKFLTIAQKKLITEELVAQTISILIARQQQQQLNSQKISTDTKLKNLLLKQLPFKPTNAQIRVTKEICEDLNKSIPMLRLLQGDVGSGKTLVAALSSLNVIEAGYQVAIMAPTEILAEQHYKKISELYKNLGINIAYLSGKQKAKEKKIELEKIITGKASIVIGTHALFQEQVEFFNLAFVIIDEQHRFGVEQRLKLLQKGYKNNKTPHQLIMTATPIPRTLAMTSYADLDVSTIDEMPKGRKSIITSMISKANKQKLIERINFVCNENKWQIYWVCPLIEESDTLDCAAAEQVALELKNELPKLEIGIVHGKLPSEEKQHIMDSFKQGTIDLLVATTVIEVGVDVPNANIIVIENPERLGLAQLHQLRGRVGRGQTQAYCILFYDKNIGEESKKRLYFLKNNTNGLDIAQKDLEIRGPGEYLGTKQTGVATMKIADFLRDQSFIEQSNIIANRMIEKYPQECKKLIDRWIDNNETYTKI